jgi:tetratricopeptide (TPR) repeat protein
VLVRALGVLWQWSGVPVDGGRWIDAMLDLAASPAVAAMVPPAVHAQALLLGSVVARLQGDYASAQRRSQQSLALWLRLDDRIGLTQGLNNVARDHVLRGEFEQADAALDESVALGSASGDAFTLSGALLVRGIAWRARGQHDRAAEVLGESVAVARTVERASYRTFAVVRALVSLGRAESNRGSSTTAIARFSEALAIMRESGLAGNLLCLCLDWLAAELGRAGDPLRAAQLFGAADAQWQRAGDRRFPFDEQAHALDLRAVQERLGAAEFGEAWARGRALSLAGVFALALAEHP